MVSKNDSRTTLKISFFLISAIWCFAFLIKIQLHNTRLNFSTLIAMAVICYTIILSYGRGQKNYDLLLFIFYLFLSSLLSFFVFGTDGKGALFMLIKLLILYPGAVLIARNMTSNFLEKALSLYPYFLLGSFILLYTFTQLDYHIINWGRLCNVVYLGAPNTMGYLFGVGLIQLVFQKTENKHTSVIKYIAILGTSIILIATFSRSAIWGVLLGLSVSGGICYGLCLLKKLQLYLFLLNFLVALLIVANLFVPTIMFKLKQVTSDTLNNYTILYKGVTYSLNTNKLSVLESLLNKSVEINYVRILPGTYFVRDRLRKPGFVSVPHSHKSNPAELPFSRKAVLDKLSSGRSVLWSWTIKKVSYNSYSLFFGYGPGRLQGTIDATPNSIIFMSLISFGLIGLGWCIFFLGLLVMKGARKIDNKYDPKRISLVTFFIFLLVTNNSVMAQQALLVSVLYFAYILSPSAGRNVLNANRLQKGG